MPEVALRPKARQDLKGVARYTIDTWGRAQARKYIRAIADTMRELAVRPRLGRQVDHIHEGLRVHPSGQHLIFYRITTAGIDVVRILHKTMDAPSHF